ncbi:cation efflux protein, CzcI family [Paracidovorax citrulli]
MRRFFLLVLMLILPFQFAWAGAAAYCQHETGPVWHFGHHDHHHQQGSDQESGRELLSDAGSGTQQDKTMLPDTDCGICHIASVPFAVAQQSSAASIRLPEIPPLLAHAMFPSHWNDAPDRPQWTSLA